MKPQCLNKFDTTKEFCKKVCSYRYECGGNEIIDDEVEEIKMAHDKGVLSIKELCEYGMRAIKTRMEKNEKSK